jgi:hypothetical protein
MSACVYSVFVLSFVKVAALLRADPSSKESYQLCKKDQETQKAAKAQQRAVEPDYNEKKIPGVTPPVGPKFGKHVVCWISGSHNGGNEEF